MPEGENLSNAPEAGGEVAPAPLAEAQEPRAPPPEVAPAPASDEAPQAVPEVPAVPGDLPRRTHRLGALAQLKLEKVDEDDSCKLRPEGDVDGLATSMARLGQLYPIDLRLRPPDRFQIVTGFRRVAALRLLKRERVLARVHTDLTDEDALRLALADLLESRGAGHAALVELRAKLEEGGRLTRAVAETLDRAINPPGQELGPELVEEADEEVDLDELAQEVIGRLASVNQDLALVAELWSALDPSLREGLLEQLAYPEQLVRYLRGL